MSALTGGGIGGGGGRGGGGGVGVGVGVLHSAANSQLKFFFDPNARAARYALGRHVDIAAHSDDAAVRDERSGKFVARSTCVEHGGHARRTRRSTS